ncbi:MULTISPECIES: helix-turn-helix domain-containing protein [unclassified Rhizobium]|uniref:TetR/AcrR family transcriptional regulator n=1 Tax=unclassified Rhizobium TaxID=2613769 RepID=UPI0017864714|nr:MULTISPECIES: helix-turn-helix domain-containing protein [unclassified Rhizobium]MBD9448119.1 helix-turn-helix transcriptional regulator [Rhizobium sp. RHZ01]MBD9455448.1 helix-turn-helix transcriptional regulator [Rhizobium sp. RHZ02]
MAETRSYNSPLREEKARETREAILRALYRLMCADAGPDEISMDAMATEAGIQRRTVFRHFPTKDDLLMAFWPWLNELLGVSIVPDSVADIVAGPQHTFPRFDAHEAAMRASLHSPTGRSMRSGMVPARRLRFGRALAPVLATLPPNEAQRVEALAHLLYSASAWEVLKDYGGLTGAQAGEAASWALDTILSAVASGSLPRT